MSDIKNRKAPGRDGITVEILKEDNIITETILEELINRIEDGVDKELRNEQAGFREGRSTIEQLFILRNIIEQSVEWQARLYINFVDFEKAYTMCNHR